MFHSKVDSYNIVDVTPFGRDVIGELMEEGLFETPATLNNTWGYKSFDQNWKTDEEVIRLKDHLNSRGINCLLNVGPDYLVRIPAPAQEILKEVGKALKEV